jgi:uncharacterized protein
MGDAPDTPELTADEKTWAMLGHLAGLLGYAVGLGQIIAPLVIYIVFRDRSRFVAFHALQSLYFQLALLVIGLLLAVVSILSCGVGAFFAVPAGTVLAIGALVYVILAAVKSSAGDWFEYWLAGDWARKTLGI